MFNARQRFGIAMGMFAMIGTGCALDAGDVDANLFDPSTLAAQGGPGSGGDPGIPNHLLPARFWDHAFQKTARDLGNGPIADTHGVMPAMPYMRANNAPGYEGWRADLLGVMIGCALHYGTGIMDSSAPIQYSGLVGLAPDWQYRALTEEEKQLVTGCMLARLNKFGDVVPILLEGLSPAIPEDPQAQQLYPLPEASVWGNLFDSTVPLNPLALPADQNNVAFDAHVCDEGTVLTCGLPIWEYTLKRVCDENYSNCGIIPSEETCDRTCPDAPSGTGCQFFKYRVRNRLKDKVNVCTILSQ